MEGQNEQTNDDLISKYSLEAQGLGASEKKKEKKILYNTTRGRTHLLPFFYVVVLN